MTGPEIRRPPPSRQRIAAGYVLGILFVVAIGYALTRGAGRVLIPVLLIAGLLVLVNRIVRKIKEPLP